MIDSSEIVQFLQRQGPKRMWSALAGGAIHMLSFTSMTCLLEVQTLYLSFLGVVVLSLLFLDKVLNPILSTDKPGKHLNAVKRGYLYLLEANIAIVVIFFASFLFYSGSWQYLREAIVENVGVWPVVFIKVAWLAIYGLLAGYIAGSFWVLLPLLIQLRFKAEYDERTKSRKQD